MFRRDFQRCLYRCFSYEQCPISNRFLCRPPPPLRRFVNVRTVRTCNVTASKLCYVTTVLARQQFPLKNVIYYKTRSTTDTNPHYPVTMASKYFKGHNDHYNGVTIDSNEEFCAPEEFADRLSESLRQWIHEKRRTIWFRVCLSHSEWIPVLTKEGFKFHHARQEYVVLYRWLVEEEGCNIPHYAHTNLGVGGFVYNQETNEVLVVKEKYYNKKAVWKLPGGYVEPGEDIEEAVKREVLEETGIQTKFNSIIAFRHAHDVAFGCSDIYIVAFLSPIDHSIKKCEKEISECVWMKVDKYIGHPEVFEHNKWVAKKMLELLRHKMGIVMEHSVHPITKKPVCLYSVSKVNSA